MDQILSHELQLRDAAGARLQLTIRELLGIFLTPTAGVFLFLTIIVHFAADPPGLRNYLDVWLAFCIWPVAAVLYLTSYVTGLGAVAFLQRRRWIGRVYLPILGIVVLTPTVSACELLVHQLTDQRYPTQILPKIPFYFVTVQVFEFAFVRLVIPQAATQRQLRRMLRLGAREIPVDRLRYLTAQEHYVRLVLDDGEQVLHRVRFADLLAQLHASDGLQPHRSWWVAGSAIPRLRRRGARHVLELACTTEIPVARTRLRAVQSWLDANGPFDPPHRRGAAPHL